MEQSSQMSINYFFLPLNIALGTAYSLGVEVGEEGLELGITTVHPDEPVRTG